MQGITGVRVEVLTDDSLPHKGPGRQDNGNLHLNEFQVRAAPRSNINESKQVLLARTPPPTSTRTAGPSRMAIDGNPQTAWGIYPKVGQPHRAVFEFEEPVGFREGTTFIFVLEQTHGGGHLIGRVRCLGDDRAATADRR